MMGMAVPFERFTSRLNRLQVSLLLDTVLYFEDSPKLLSVPTERGEAAAVPLTAAALRAMLSALDDQEEHSPRPFIFHWEAGETESQGMLVVELPNGQTVRQSADLTRFSAV
jgi:hypothetical protein